LVGYTIITSHKTELSTYDKQKRQGSRVNKQN